ncbi:MAG TPA: L,D-transpeptidase [Anaerolineales bacterium]|nr:L,D-transpeptidase [Anaerolineales bacterium]HNN12860.1 L,D-transpeptidase [Anaerolineales bacterium]HNO30256.1 L,D-transpeptidase [Anaerolineales bacterium]
MKKPVSRRDFLKLAGLGLGVMAFQPYSRRKGLDYVMEALAMPKRLPQFPASEIIGRVTDPDVDIRNRPTNDPNLNSSIGKLGADTLVEWGREVIGNVIGGLSNQRYVETPQGYVYASVVQPTRNLPNTPLTAMPAGQSGFWAEVTVPYVELAMDGVVASPWLQDHITYNFPPRLYYGQVVWIDQIRANNGFTEYRWNEDANGHGYGYGAYGEFFWADGAAFKVLTDADVAPINPDFDPNEKTIKVDLDYQTLSCMEGSNEVYYCRISSGKKFDPVSGAVSDQFATPAGTLMTHWKIISKNMTAGSAQAGYSTPAVPWCTFISGEGIAIHGAFWHNAFGERRSHGCVNVSVEDAKWIFRWTTPAVSLAAGEERRTLPDHGTIVNSDETVF